MTEKKIWKLMYCQAPGELILNKPLLEKLLKDYTNVSSDNVHIKIKRIKENLFTEIREETIENNITYFEVGITDENND